MAIDTLAKRSASLTLDSFLDDGMPIPDGTFDQSDRQQLLNGYILPLWDEPVVPEGGADRSGRIRLGMGLGIP